jgi:hypothetical protein
MKSKILSILILIFVCFEINAQDVKKEGPRFSLYSELSSHIRGNRSSNLTFEVNHGLLRYSVGFDHYYAIRANIRRFQPGTFNYMWTGRFGLSPVRNKKDLFAFGLMLKYGKYHLLEAEGRDLKNSGDVYSKEFNKLAPMVFIQINTVNTIRFYGGFLGAIGVVHILNQDISRSDVPATSFGYGDYILNQALEFGLLSTEDRDPGPQPVLQLNFLCGIWF